MEPTRVLPPRNNNPDTVVILVAPKPPLMLYMLASFGVVLFLGMTIVLALDAAGILP